MSILKDFIVEVCVESKITKEELDIYLRIKGASSDEVLSFAQNDFINSYSHYFHPIEYRAHPIH